MCKEVESVKKPYFFSFINTSSLSILMLSKIFIFTSLAFTNFTVAAGAPPPMDRAHFLGGRPDETTGTFPFQVTSASYWSNPGNWKQGVLPTSGSNTEILFAEDFENGILTDIEFPSTLDRNWTLGAMLIDVFPHSGYDEAFFNSRNGARLTLHRAIEIGGLRNDTRFDIPIVLGSNIDILTSNVNEPGNTLSGQQYFFNFTDPINTNGNRLSLRSNGSDIRVSAPITGSGDVRIFGGNGARVSLRAVNTYTGQTIVNSGDLRIDIGARLADASDLVVNNSARVIFSMGSADAINGLKGNGLGDARVGISGGNTLVIGNYDGFGAIGEGSFSGRIFGDGNLVKRGRLGTQTLSGLITLAGDIIAEEGVLRLLNGANVTGANQLIVGEDGILEAQSNTNFSHGIVDGQATFSGNNSISSMIVGNGTGITNAELVQNGGTNNYTLLQLGNEAGSAGYYQLNSGTVQASGATIGYFGEGVFDHFGGDHNVGALSFAEGAGSTAQYSLEGGTLTTEVTELASPPDLPEDERGNATFVNGGGTHTTDRLELGNGGGTGLDDSGEGYYEITGGVTNADRINIWSTGILFINGGVVNARVIDNRFTGQLDFAAGTLSTEKIFGSLVNVGGILSPGNSPGLLTISGDYTQQTNASMLIELGGITPETEYDVVEVDGTATLDGTLDVVLYNGFIPNDGDSFDILTATSIVGVFSLVNLPTIQGVLWELQYLIDEIGTTDVVRLIASVQPVPLPASIWMFMAALGALGLLKRKN